MIGGSLDLACKEYPASLTSMTPGSQHAVIRNWAQTHGLDCEANRMECCLLLPQNLSKTEL